MRHKKQGVGLGARSVGELRRRRRQLARTLHDPAATVPGALGTQGRRCGKAGCRCPPGELPGPYGYVALPRGRGGRRLRYVPAECRAVVRQKIALTARMVTAWAAISAINVER